MNVAPTGSLPQPPAGCVVDVVVVVGPAVDVVLVEVVVVEVVVVMMVVVVGVSGSQESGTRSPSMSPVSAPQGIGTGPPFSDPKVPVRPLALESVTVVLPAASSKL